MTATGTFRQWRLSGPRNIELVSLPRPTVATDEALLSIRCATTCGTDVKVYQAGGHARMLVPPCPFGHEMVGVLEEVGPEFTGRFREGDRVVVSNSSPCLECRQCRLGRENLCTDLRYINGAFGDLLLLPRRFERSLHVCPEGLPDAHACLAEPLACVLHCLEQIGPALSRYSEAIPPRAVIMGAGPLGLLLVALLREAGARVTSVDPNPDRLEAAAAMGAGERVLYRRVLDDLRDLRQSYDVAIDASGTLQGWRNTIAAVAAGGEAVLFGGIPGGGDLNIDAHRVHYEEIDIRGLYHHRPELFEPALQWLLRRPDVADALIHRHVPLEELPTALDDMEKRRALKVSLVPRRRGRSAQGAP